MYLFRLPQAGVVNVSSGSGLRQSQRTVSKNRAPFPRTVQPYSPELSTFSSSLAEVRWSCETTRARASVRPYKCRRRVCVAASGEDTKDVGSGGEEPTAAPFKAVSYKKILVCLMDENPYLSLGSRQTIAAAAQLANSFKGHLVVVSLDRPAWTFNGSVRADTIAFYMKESNCEEYEMVAVKVEEDDAAIAIADLADDIDGTYLMLSTNIVEDGHLDANALAKFAGCSFAFVE